MPKMYKHRPVLPDPSACPSCEQVKFIYFLDTARKFCTNCNLEIDKKGNAYACSENGDLEKIIDIEELKEWLHEELPT